MRSRGARIESRGARMRSREARIESREPRGDTISRDEGPGQNLVRREAKAREPPERRHPKLVRRGAEKEN